MLLHLIAFGFITVGGQVVTPGTGTVDVPADMTAVAKPGTSSGVGTGMPPTAFALARPLDPSDTAKYAFDFEPTIGDANIASLDRVQMSALGASLGLIIESTNGRQPIIDTAGKKIGFWVSIDSTFEFNSAFATAQKMGISFQITTDESPSQTFERTCVLTVVNQ